jgi:hypothetical protein
MTKAIMTNPVDKMRRAWGGAAPAWVVAMAEECQASSQNRVAEKMGWSAATISMVLNSAYSGDLAAVEEGFKGAFEGALVHCPALGGLTSQACREWRKRSRKFTVSNTLGATMFRACNACPRNEKEAGQ